MMAETTEFDAPIIISGPCAIESYDIVREVAEVMKELSAELGFTYYLKGSFDKANRTSISSYRGPGLEEGLAILKAVKSDVGVKVTTDIHEPHQAEVIAGTVDLLQIPAFLCRQTDLLLAAGRTGRPVNIKKGQFMAPQAMRHAVEKVKSAGNGDVFVTERGTFFGYGDLVVDFRGMSDMRAFAPVIFDAGHSVQQPASSGVSSSGQRKYIQSLARAAATQGIDGLFFETHPDPDTAKSDGPNMVKLSSARDLVEEFSSIWKFCSTAGQRA